MLARRLQDLRCPNLWPFRRYRQTRGSLAGVEVLEGQVKWTSVMGEMER
jgi:translation initiation factor IF-2